MMATSILAFSSLGILYLSIRALSLIGLMGFKIFLKQPPDRRALNDFSTLQAEESAL